VKKATDAHFDYSSLFSDAQVEKVGNPKKVKTERTKQSLFYLKKKDTSYAFN
jgi:hypothetical protein